MWQWIVQNSGTILVCAVLAVLFALLIFARIRDKKRGKSCCGSCDACGCHGMCRSSRDKKEP